jgi:hypothetical protein
MKKFSTPASAKKSSDLSVKMDTIAQAIADEMITGMSTLRMQGHISEKTKVLESLTKYLAISNKVEPPAENGGAFDAYRQSATDGAREGTPSTARRDRGSRFDETGKVIPIGTARGSNRADDEEEDGDPDSAA